MVQVGVVSMYTMVPLLFLSWKGIVSDRAHSVVLSSTRMTHGVEGLATPRPAESHTLLDSTDTDCQHWMIYLSSSLVVYFI